MLAKELNFDFCQIKIESFLNCSSLAHSPPPSSAMNIPPQQALVANHSNILLAQKTEEALELVNATAAAVERRAAAISSEIRTVFCRLAAALAEREQKVLMRVERVSQAKLNVLKQQVNEIYSTHILFIKFF